MTNKIVLLTRSENQNQKLIQSLGDAVEIFTFPLLKITSLEHEAISSISNLHFDMVIFTSSNSISSSLLESIKGARIACVGEETAALVKLHGFTVNLIPTIHTQEALAELIIKTTTKSDRIALFQGSSANNYLIDTLIGSNLNALKVITYKVEQDNYNIEYFRELTLNISERLRLNNKVFIVLMSALSAEYFFELLQTVPLKSNNNRTLILDQAIFVCIGEITSKAVKTGGAMNIHLPLSSTASAICNLIMDF